MHGPVGAIGIEGNGDAVALEDVAQRRHDRGDTFAAVLQGGVQQPLGGIDDGDQREPSLRAQRQPMVPTAVEMEQLAEAGARLAAAAMATPRLVLGHQAGGLQGLLHKGIAKAHAVFAAGAGENVGR